MKPEERFAELWTNYLEGDLDADGQAELRALLESDAALQQQAVDLLQVHRLLGFTHQNSAEAGEAFVAATLVGLPRNDAEFVASVMRQIPETASGANAREGRSDSRARSEWRSWVALACGLLMGVLASSAAWAYALPRGAIDRPAVVLDEGFEAAEAPQATGIPTQSGAWAGDFCELTGVRADVRPAGGQQMFRFLRADYENKPQPAGSYVSDIYRLVDVRAYRQALEDGSAVLQVSASFNAELFPDQEKYFGSMSLYALDAETATNGSTRQANTLQVDSLAFTRGARLLLDRQPQTWQPLATELRLPPDTDYALIRIGLIHGSAAQRRPEFPGHYLDNVRLSLVRRPLPGS
jgi:hypothetical protein